MANEVQWTGSMCPVLNFCTKMDIVLSVCWNQQLQLDDSVAQCVSKVLSEDKFCRSVQVVSKALWTRSSWFYICPSNCIFAYIIYSIAVRVKKYDQNACPLGLFVHCKAIDSNLCYAGKNVGGSKCHYVQCAPLPYDIALHCRNTNLNFFLKFHISRVWQIC
mgnify:CR=1 FL=1